MTDNTVYEPSRAFEELPKGFADAVEPAEFPKHKLRYRNDRWARAVGLNQLDDMSWVRHFGEFKPLTDNLPTPLALRYHGHQFRTYNTEIGDGRGFLFAQLYDQAGRLLDLGTKGSGQTPYSRFGDGRLTLKGGVREVLATAMLEAQSVRTSKSFSLIETGESLTRQDEPSPTRSCVLVRLSHSHIRFGAFQRQAYEKNTDNLQALVDYCCRHFYPDLLSEVGTDRVVAFFNAVVRASARLAAEWMAAGFVHGVLNTDNFNITGESFDYGPYRFVPFADPNFTAAYFDHYGLYAYGRQPEAVGWALAQLANALALIAPQSELQSQLELYPAFYQYKVACKFFARLGLQPSNNRKSDVQLVTDILAWMNMVEAPFEQLFFDWFCGVESKERAESSPEAILYKRSSFANIRDRIVDLIPERPERLAHTYFLRRRPATILIDEIEAIWSRIEDYDDWSAFYSKLEDIEEMRAAYA